MKLYTGWVMLAGLLGTAGTADAQIVSRYSTGNSPYTTVSDVGGPYAEMPALRYGYGPTLLPVQEVYTVVRESGFSPVGIPRQRGLVYTIAVIDRSGDDGRLVIDARTGRIIRFTPAYQMGDNFNDAFAIRQGRVGPLPPVDDIRGAPKPPKAVPHVAARTPVPKPSPLAARPAAAEPLQQAQQPAAAQAKSAEAQAVPPAATATVGQAKPAPEIAPTQEMPKAMGLE